MLEAADAPTRAGQKKVRVRYAYDQFGIWALLALHTVPRMCNLRILKAVDKFDSRRLHQLLYFHIFRYDYRVRKSIVDVGSSVITWERELACRQSRTEFGSTAVPRQ